jgi:di/tricarboxylate transporter
VSVRLGYIAVALLLLTSIAAAVALTHMSTLPAFIAIAPGYAVQSWLFETHHALGGIGYQVTMVGVSAIVWTLILLSPAGAVRLLRRSSARRNLRARRLDAQPPDGV